MNFKDKLRQRAIKNNSIKVLKKINIYDVLIKPIYSEKSYNFMNNLNRYCFKINNWANKNDVKVAIEKIYNIKPEKINIINVKDKWRANRKLVRRWYKKAIIILKEWEKINISDI